MCFVRSWNTGLAAMCRAAWLSQYKRAGCKCVTCKSCKRYLSHTNSQVRDAMDLYSDSAEERDTIDCFLLFQDMGAPPRKMQNPVTDRLVVGQLAQSASQYPFNCSLPCDGNKTPWPGAFFK
ncbi:unnamed protein product [Prunus brigantina]